MILDANIVIYAANKPPQWLSDLVLKSGNSVASVVKIEVYGFPGLQDAERRALDDLFAHWKIHPLDDAIIARTIEIRQLRRMGLGDAIIAATALVHQKPLVTRNVDDFKHIAGLQLVNPFGE